ncbi:CRISPR-associated helicase Cas3' [Geobacillus sp. G4]|uniref:CRISPR-associated helicase Cas3' n=1 Tax=Geobacillus TaxID=129337 RepID=UPI00205DBB92|nr:CRISPR-associated helicase Cas3' [Geobacillus thermoleovorans]UPT60090.1 CRISPR-associated helicase Cas3' [Geobacillus thermoleovorans]
MNDVYAHTPRENEQEWHRLDDHLLSVAEMAQSFAAPFHGGRVAYLCGLLHDLGKFHPFFQEYLQKQANGEMCRSIPHAIWGAAFMYQLYWGKIRDPHAWKWFSLPIAGHHAGLHSPDYLSITLKEKLEKQSSHFLEILKQAEWFLKKFVFPRIQSAEKIPSFSDTEREMWIRLVFSALVDADYLDTERHFQPELSPLRRPTVSITDLWNMFAADQEQVTSHADDTAVNRMRREVYEECVRAAAKQQGVYRLTVPTGGGKTRSSLAFALKHAVEHGLDRVIVAIPYTSIIEQTADVYRGIFGNDAVLEHHSQIEVDDEKEKEDERLIQHRLSAENWDAPLIVTTTVQLFDSLFSNRPSKVRKLHNLSRSVIILDEVQALPAELLKPTLDALAMLVRHCQTTVVLSSATQPFFEESRFLDVFSQIEVKEILPLPIVNRHFQQMQRVDYEIWKSPVSLPQLVRFIREQKQLLVVFNTRKEAKECVELLQEDDGVFHLSTLLCSAHRRRILEEVRERLKKNQPVRLISTQVVEAGVDLDFPIVMRQMGPLDRIVQAAGRCNREGKMDKGKVIIFETEDMPSPRGSYRTAMETARFLLAQRHPNDLHNPNIFREYFRRLFASVDVDSKNIQKDREMLDYPLVAEKYRLIDQDTVSVIVPYEEASEYLRMWESSPSRYSFRRLQPYMVQLYRFEAEKKEKDGWLREVADNVYEWLGDYDERIGIKEEVYDPFSLIG